MHGRPQRGSGRRLARELADVARAEERLRGVRPSPAIAFAAWREVECGERSLVPAPTTPFHRALDHASLASVRAELESDPHRRDPDGHFFEMLVAAWNRAERRRAGVYFTPRPIVSFLVRSADLLLHRLGFPDGLASGADSGVHVVDPACGCGAFLSEVLRTADRIPVTGFELHPATAQAAGWILERRFPRQRNWQILEANPLEMASHVTSIFPRDDGACCPVVLGNPPFSNFGRRNQTAWIQRHLKDYKQGLSERKTNLNDDYVKFLRWGQALIEDCGQGILGFVTNHAWLTGLTHGRMRDVLRQAFQELYALDLHGHVTGRRCGPPDDNLFGIRQGIAAVLFVKHGETSAPAEARRAEVVGSLNDKLTFLSHHDVGTVAWQPWPSKTTGGISRNGDDVTYDDYLPVDRLFRYIASGVQTKCDRVLVGWTADALMDQLESVRAGGREAPAWLVERLQRFPPDCRHVRRYAVAPFDHRWVYYDPRVLGRARHSVVRHVLAGSPGLILMRQSTNEGEYDHALAVREPASDRVFSSARGAPFIAPLRLADEENGPWNVDAEAAEYLSGRAGDPENAPSDAPLELRSVHYAYAVLHATAYRRRFATRLARGFPRIPPAPSPDGFAGISELGGQLWRLHTEGPEDLSPVCGTAREPVRRPASNDDPLVFGTHCPRWETAGPGEGRVWLNARDRIEGVDRSVWEVRIGGRQVAARWLRQRRKRGLSHEELERWCRLYRILAATLQLRLTIDRLIQHYHLIDEPSETV